MTTRVVVLHYPEVAAPNGLLLDRAARAGGLSMVGWSPHDLQVAVGPDGAQVLHRGVAVRPEAVLHRTVAPFATLVLPALQLWQRDATVVLNPAGPAFASRDKLATALTLAAAGLPVVPTVALDPGAWVADLGPGGPVVVKPAHGLRGQDVVAVADRREVELPPAEADDGRWHPREAWLVQDLVGPGGRDLRGFVVDGRCVALMRRQARPGELRANMALGATAEPLGNDHPAAGLAVEAVAACGLDYAGVDLLEDADGNLFVSEVDAWAGFAGLTTVTGVDVAGAIVELVLRRIA